VCVCVCVWGGACCRQATWQDLVLVLVQKGAVGQEMEGKGMCGSTTYLHAAAAPLVTAGAQPDTADCWRGARPARAAAVCGIQ
jgi:hypothetical protein